MPLPIEYRPVALPPAIPADTASCTGDRQVVPGFSTRDPQTCPQAAPRLLPLEPVRIEGVALAPPPPRAIMRDTAMPSGSRPRDFTARIGRRDAQSVRRALRQPALWRQRLAGVGAVGLLGAVLTPLGWGTPGGIEPAAAQVRTGTLQPFERGGESFPGSAFYFVAPEDSGLLAPKAAEAAWDAQLSAIHRDDATATTAATSDIIGGAAARPLVARGSGDDQWRALQCLTAAIYYEAASEPDGGQRAVAQVVLNRVSHPAFPKTVCGVVYQGSERPGCQFSFACDGSLARRPAQVFWDRARRVAADALAGYVYAPVGLATHYHTSAVHPYWADSLTFLGTIGAHRFYRWAGTAGRPAAFTTVYAGGEPTAAPHPRTWTPAPTDITDPLRLEQAFESGRLSALQGGTPSAATPTTATPAPAPSYVPGVTQRGGDALYRGADLPGASNIRPEYRNSGTWIAQPTS